MSNQINLQKISKLISQKLNKTVEIINMEQIGSGYHSDGFKLTAKNNQNFFLKHIKSHDRGFEIPERKITSLLISNNMFNRSKTSPEAIGVIVDNGSEAMIIPEINEKTAIYHLQEFQSESISYWTLLQRKKEKTRIDEQDLAELEEITSYISKIHRIKHPTKNIEQLKSIYNDGLRSILTSPELTFTLLHDFSNSHPILPSRKHGKYIELILNQINKWKDRQDRLVALHGDFWGANIFFKQTGAIWAIDYSRIPWGDRGIDIGWWFAQYLWLYCETKNEYFKRLGEKFLNMYIAKSGDTEIRQALVPVLGLMGIIYISPKFYPNLNIKTGKKFLLNIVEILKNNKLIWKK